MAQITLTINLPVDYDRDKLANIIDAILDLESNGDTVILAAGPGPTLNSDGTPAPAPARRGRKPNAEKAAARQAEAEAAHAAANAAHPAPPPPPPAAAPTAPPPPPPPPAFQQAAVPPVPNQPPSQPAHQPSAGVALSPAAPVYVPQPASAPPQMQQSIMTQPAPVGPPGADGVPTYTREQVLDAVNRIPGGGALFFRRITQAYGYATVESVPPEYYNFVMQELFKPINM